MSFSRWYGPLPAFPRRPLIIPDVLAPRPELDGRLPLTCWFCTREKPGWAFDIWRRFFSRDGEPGCDDCIRPILRRGGDPYAGIIA